MLIGLDVGGTYTDAVLLDGQQVIKKIKKPTDNEHLLDTLVSTLDPLLDAAQGEKLERIVLSTTLITNLIATKRIEPAALVIIPGPGLNPNTYDYHVPDTYLLSVPLTTGGREIEPSINRI